MIVFCHHYNLYVTPTHADKVSGARILLHRSCCIWNSLPNKFRAAPTFNTFMRRLKAHLLTWLLISDLADNVG